MKAAIPFQTLFVAAYGSMRGHPGQGNKALQGHG